MKNLPEARLSEVHASCGIDPAFAVALNMKGMTTRVI